MIKIASVNLIIPIFAVENHNINNTHFNAEFRQEKEAMADKTKEQVQACCDE